ncbi:GAF domain-containing protein, partial [bacterium]|nr:GAF domain-containing protein [bacterium]
TADGKSTPVGVEIAPLLIGGHHKGGYAYVTDISRAVEMHNKIYDMSPLGIVKLDTKGAFTYANAKALEICGTDTLQGKTVKDILPDEKNFATVETNLARRKTGLSDEYELEITRLNDGKRIPLVISAMPVTDLSGNVLGSMAIMRNMLQEKTIEAIHKHIITIRDGKQILEAVAKETQQVIPFDRFSVAVYSDDMKHLRQLFSYCPGEVTDPIKWQIRWWEIPDSVADWLKQKETPPIGDIEAFLSEDRWKNLRHRPEIKQLLEEGYRSIIRCPIIREDRIVASVTLYSKTKHAFDGNHLELLKKLPLEKAVHMALYYDKTEDLAFRLDLIREISSVSNSIKKVGDLIVSRVAEHYDWQNVSLFRVDEGRHVIRLLSQKASSKALLIPEDYEQPMDKGVLGYVYSKKRGVNIPNVHTDPNFKDIFKSLIEGTKSELCLPIITDQVCWLLNIEDFRQNAFSEEEKNALEEVVNELAALLKRSWLYNFLKASLESASDAVIVTDSMGNITRANPSTKEL